MVNNDILRSVRYMLDLSDAHIVAIAKLANYELNKEDVAAFLKKEDEEGYLELSDEAMAYFLDGLVFHKRGKDESRPAQPIELPMSNNMALKKLRVAFELKEEDMHSILSSVGFDVSKPELSALFRKKDHKHYRNCGDQLLRNFLKGLTLRLRG